jgi:hypothetical protein
MPVEEEATSDLNRVDTIVARTSAHLRIVTQGSLSLLLSTEDGSKNLSSTNIFSEHFIKVVAHTESPGFRAANQEETTSKRERREDGLGLPIMVKRVPSL